MRELEALNNIRYFEAPSEEYFVPEDGKSSRSIFIAGGITGCEEWQFKTSARILENTKDDVCVFNPRRKNFVMEPGSSEKQIEWEFHHLRHAHCILFWFAPRQMQPIVLYELGAHSNAKERKPIFVGVHVKYPRYEDVLIQTKLIRPEIKIFHTLTGLENQVIDYFNKGGV